MNVSGSNICCVMMMIICYGCINLNYLLFSHSNTNFFFKLFFSYFHCFTAFVTFFCFL
ncbi:uncharacterized protein DS421_16g545580 [Arachis hypogaea]|nr:uncharacterized protein DS421_16g545580 [Arachis hypogaea]